MSPERIFEFPEVKKKRRRYRTVTFKACPVYDTAQHFPPYSPGVVQTGLHGTAGAANSDRFAALTSANDQWVSTPAGRPAAVDTNTKYQAWLEVSARQGEANAEARAVCRGAGARLTGNARIHRLPGATHATAIIYYSENLGSGGNYQYRVGVQVYFDATCKKRR